jgi:hypothetical protein
MVLLDLGRLVPALRLALMLAYKPGRFDFISRIVTRRCLFVQIHAKSSLRKAPQGRGRGRDKRSPLPLLSFAVCIVLYI